MSIKRLSGYLAESHQIFTKCVFFLFKNKDLFLFPIASILMSIGIFCLGMVGFIRYAYAQNDVTIFTSLIVCYFVISFIVVFLNSAFIACVLSRASGQKCGVMKGLGIAFQRTPQIFLWSIFASSIGLILSMLEEGNSIVKTILLQLISFTWTITAYFVVPFIIMDGLYPLASIRKSAALMGKQWRNTIGVGAMLFLYFLPIILLLQFFLYYSVNGMSVFILWMVFSVIFFVLCSMLNGIIKSTLYLYMEKKIEPVDFPQSFLESVITRNAQ